MAFSSTTIYQPKTQPTAPLTKVESASALLAALLMTMYAGKASAKQLRKLKRKFAWEAFKLKAKSFLSNPFKPQPQSISDRTLIYILIGVLVVILLFVSPIAAIAVLLLGILLVLLLRL